MVRDGRDGKSSTAEIINYTNVSSKENNDRTTTEKGSICSGCQAPVRQWYLLCDICSGTTGKKENPPNEEEGNALIDKVILDKNVMKSINYKKPKENISADKPSICSGCGASVRQWYLLCHNCSGNMSKEEDQTKKEQKPTLLNENIATVENSTDCNQTTLTESEKEKHSICSGCGTPVRQWYLLCVMCSTGNKENKKEDVGTGNKNIIDWSKKSSANPSTHPYIESKETSFQSSADDSNDWSNCSLHTSLTEDELSIKNRELKVNELPQPNSVKMAVNFFRSISSADVKKSGNIDVYSGKKIRRNTHLTPVKADMMRKLRSHGSSISFFGGKVTNNSNTVNPGTSNASEGSYMTSHVNSPPVKTELTTWGRGGFNSVVFDFRGKNVNSHLVNHKI